MRRRLRNYKEVNFVTRLIPHLMRCARGNPNSHPSIQRHGTSIHFHHGLTRQDVKELLCVMVEVTNPAAPAGMRS